MHSNSPELAEAIKPFLGAWQLVSAVSDGQPASEAAIQNVRVEIAAGSHTVYVGGQIVAHSIPFTIDFTSTPHRTIDLLPDGQQIKGISRVDGDTLTSCVAAVGQEYPEEFASRPGAGHTLRVFKRLGA